MRKMNRFFLSIIIPSFNNDMKLVDCLESIFKQRFHDCEVIVVDDGSSDNTRSYCELYLKENYNFKYFYQKNRGVSSARNMGLELASGEYVLFVDSDDSLLPHSLISLCDFAKGKVDTDIVVGNYIARYNDIDRTINQEHTGSHVQFIERAITGVYHSALWNKMIKRECIGNTKFDEDLKYMEDQLFLMDILLKEPNINFLSKPIYIYNQYHNSNVSFMSEGSVISSALAMKIITKRLKGRVASCYLNLYISRCILSAILYTNKRYYQVFDFDIKFSISPELSIYKRFIIWMYVHNFNVAIQLIRKLYRWKTARS
ncbi:glycosyltransferase family 2 protein [Aeromonas caviae]